MPLVTVAVVLLSIMSARPAAAGEPEGTGAMVEYPMVFPVDGPHWFYDGFWEARSHGLHAAVDIFADKGVGVLAVADATVRFVNWSSSPDDLAPEACCSIVLAHDDGWSSSYIHLDNDTPGTDDGLGWGIADGIAPGSRVAAGQLIGWVGDSGNAEDTPPHVHFSLRDGRGTTVDPFLALTMAGGAGGGGASDPLYDGGTAVRAGDGGVHVTRLQEDLVRLGFDVGPIDGAYGPRTQQAVTAFQSSYRLEADGVVGTMTRAALAGLLLAEGSSVIGFGRSGDGVAETQRMLAEAGLDVGPVDGRFGPRTLNAVLSFQRAVDIVVDGLVGPQTRSALGEPR